MIHVYHYLFWLMKPEYLQELSNNPYLSVLHSGLWNLKIHKNCPINPILSAPYFDVWNLKIHKSCPVIPILSAVYSGLWYQTKPKEITKDGVCMLRQTVDLMSICQKTEVNDNLAFLIVYMTIMIVLVVCYRIIITSM